MNPSLGEKESLHMPSRLETVDLAKNTCEVTEGARQQLEAWGIPDSSIETLAELAAQYEYNDAEARTKDVVKNGVFVSEDERGNPVVVLPDFYDLEGDRPTGQCAEITFKVLRYMVKGGWLDEVNAANLAAGRPLIDRDLVQGEPSTHFSKHFWIDLHAKDGKDDDDSIIIDGSLRKILLHSESGYTSTFARNAEGYLSMPRREVLEIGRIEPGEANDWIIDGVGSSFLSMTADYVMGIDVGYGVNPESGIQPVLYIYDNSDTSIAICTRIDGQISWQDPDNIVDVTRRAELESIVDMLEGIPLNYDKSAYVRYRDNDLNEPQEMSLEDMRRIID